MSWFAAGAMMLGAGGACDPQERDLGPGKKVFHDAFDGDELASHWQVGRVDGPASKGGGARTKEDRAGHWRRPAACVCPAGYALMYDIDHSIG